jgi:polyhydroxyalkanoate synthesis regulator phasin
MVDKAQTTDPIATAATDGAPATPPPPRRGPGHRGADVRDTVAEMAARAQEISQEAGSKVAAAMKDVISAAAGLAGFAIESARDLVQYMVRRGQMTQEEGDKLLREAEEAHVRRGGSSLPTRSQMKAAEQAAAAAAAAANRAAAMPAPAPAPVAVKVVAPPPAPAKPIRPPSAPVKKAPAAKKAPAKPAKAPKAPAKKPAAKKAPAKASKSAAKKRR